MTEPIDAAADLSRYQLTPEQNAQIFREDIVPDQLADAQPQDLPIAVVLVGQPGAGKTRTAQQVRDVLSAKGGFVEVDSDLYKPFHPQYSGLMATDDRLMAAAIGPDGRAWMAQVQDYIRQHRLHALVHETAQNPEYFAQTLQDYRDAGFRVVVIALGVPEALSRQGILNRYCDQVRDRGAGRLTVPEKAAASYTGIPEAARLVDHRCLADAVVVLRRSFDSAHPAYYNELAEPGCWRTPPGFAAAITTERQRPLTEAECADFRQTQRRLRAEAPGDFEPELDEIDRLARPLLSSPGSAAAATTARVAAACYPTSVRDITLGTTSPDGSREAPRAPRPGVSEHRQPPRRGR